MNLRTLAGCIEKAVTQQPGEKLLTWCGGERYYQPYYYLLFLLAHRIPGVAVELGVEKGRGSAAMSLAGIPVYGFDHYEKLEVKEVQKWFKYFHYSVVSSLPVPEVLGDKKIGLLHIDTEHSHAQAREEFNAYKEYLTSPAVVLFDDLHAEEDGVLKFFADLPYPKIQDDRLHPSCGYGVVLYAA